MEKQTQTDIEAATFRRLLDHLDKNKDVQNIELMVLADFCRNCLAKWYAAEAESHGEQVDYETAREVIYKMPYSTWKERYQLPATQQQLDAYNARQQKKSASE